MGCKGPIPLAGQSSHPTGVVTDEVEEGYAAGVPILGNPGRQVPHEECGRVSLLVGCVDLWRYSGRSLRGDRVHWVNPIRVQHGLVAAGKGSVSGREKYAQYVQIVGAKFGWTPRPAMVKGRDSRPKSLATHCSRESSAS